MILQIPNEIHEHPNYVVLSSISPLSGVSYYWGECKLCSYSTYKYTTFSVIENSMSKHLIQIHLIVFPDKKIHDTSN